MFLRYAHMGPQSRLPDVTADRVPIAPISSRIH
jgi:hypothetical protein